MYEHPLSNPSLPLIDDGFAENAEIFMEVAIELACEFLSCGGPVTRLEGQLMSAGAHLGCDTIVHATPSAITVYCQIRSRNESCSRGGRIHNFGLDLGRLSHIDKVLGRFAKSEITPDQVLVEIHKSRRPVKGPNPGLHFLTVMGIGMGAALLSGLSLAQATICGIFSATIQVLILLCGRLRTFSPVFGDFFSCFLAFLFAMLLGPTLEIRPQLLALGTLVYVVPGLLMTTAISEVVDQNYLSGSIRLLKAFCIFIAMTLAYFLATDIGRLTRELAPGVFSPVVGPTFWVRLAGSVLITWCAAFEFRASPTSIPGILICGLMGTLTYLVVQTPGSLVAPHFFASFVIGVVSYVLSRIYHHPSQIYSVPSILVLAPGMLALSSFGYGAQDDLNLPSIVRATMISLAIVFGLAASRLFLQGLGESWSGSRPKPAL